MDKNLDMQVILSEVKNGYKAQSKSIDALKSQARTVFGASSVILSLASVLQILSQDTQGHTNLFQCIIAGSVVLYIFLVILSLIILSSMEFLGPVKLEWDTLRLGYTGGNNEREILKQQISNYLHVIGKNRKRLKRRNWMTIFQSIIFALIVVLVILAGLFSTL